MFLLPLAAAADVTVSVIGQPVNVWSAVDQLHKCGQIDVPDVPAKIFNDQSDVTHMIAGSTNFHVMLGTPLNQTRSCKVAFNMTGDPDPADFAADEFLDATHAFDNGTVYALFDTEYPGDRYPGMCPPWPNGTTRGYPYCYMVTQSLAVSHDWGLTWAHARPPPQHLVAAVPYVYNVSRPAYGWAAPALIRSPNDQLFYVLIWNKHAVGLQDAGITVMRTADLTDPASWRGLDADGGFTVPLVSPYTMAPGTEAQHICRIVNLPASGCAPYGLVFSVPLQKFVVTLGCYDTYERGAATSHRVFMIATSDDLITWSNATVFYSPADLPANVSATVTGMTYPSFMDPTSPSAFGDRNFGTIGSKPYLYWVSIGHSPHTDGRHLWATPMELHDTKRRMMAASYSSSLGGLEHRPHYHLI